MASQEPFTYTVSALRGHEPICQAILSTFRFGVDHGVASAAEASIVKRVALAYAAVHVPGREFVGGVFVEPPGQARGTELHPPRGGDIPHPRTSPGPAVRVEPGDQTDARESLSSSEALLHTAPRAIVEFAARDQDYRGRVGISVEKTDGTWKILGRVEPRPRLSRWSWLNDVL